MRRREGVATCAMTIEETSVFSWRVRAVAEIATQLAAETLADLRVISLMDLRVSLMDLRVISLADIRVISLMDLRVILLADIRVCWVAEATGGWRRASQPICASWQLMAALTPPEPLSVLDASSFARSASLCNLEICSPRSALCSRYPHAHVLARAHLGWVARGHCHDLT